MVNLHKHLHSAILGWGLAVALSVVLPGANAQQTQSNPSSPNPDVTHQQVAMFDQFLDQHPDIDKQLMANPSLINNADFVEDHPELGKFLASHKEVSEEIKENPSNFMRREQGFDNRENRARNPNPDVTHQEVASFDQFLDKHPDIDKQLTANPSLINNADFVKGHPELGQFLTSHQEISEEIKENPSDFMRREQRFDNRENRATNPNPDVTHGQVVAFDQFLDKHPDIDKQLAANPSLINNADFVKNHPELGEFMTSHKEMSEEIKENPSDFMRREHRFDAGENSMAKAKLTAQNPDLTPQQVAAFDQFLDHHKSIDKDLEKNPNLVNDDKFLKNHHELKKFMEKNPEVAEEFKENPSNFMQQESRFDRSERDHDKNARFDKDDKKKDRDHDKDARPDKDDKARKDRDDHDKSARSDKDDKVGKDRDDRDQSARSDNDDKTRKDRDDHDKVARSDKDDKAGKDRDDHDKSARSDKDDRKGDRDHDKDARSDKDDKNRKDRDDHNKVARSDKDRHADKDMHRVAKDEHKSALEEKERLQTNLPH